MISPPHTHTRNPPQANNGNNSGILKLKNQRPKYQITHPSGKVANLENVRLRLHYNVQPWAGLLTWDQSRDFFKWEAMRGGVSSLFSLPEVKAKN